MSFNRTQFDAFVESLQLRFFTSGELLSRQYKKPNGPPPIMLWHNIVPTIMVLEELRAVLDSPVKIICAYRNEAYNDNGNDGRAKLSQHQAYSAIDFQVPGHSVKTVAAMVASWNNARWFGSAIPFERRPAKVSAGAIPFGALPQRCVGNAWASDHPYEFLFKGFVKAYPSASSNFIHIDTRGEMTVDGEE
jgi:hypothetical protein